MTGVLNEEAFGLGNRESQYENEVWAQSRGAENDGRYCPGFLPSWSLVKVARCSHQKYIYMKEREDYYREGRGSNTSIGEYDTFFMDLPFYIIGQNTCYAGLSIL